MVLAMESSTIAIIVEAAVALFLLLAFVLGAVKGFIKISHGIIATLAAVAIAAFTVTPIVGQLSKLKFKDNGADVTLTDFIVSRTKLDENLNKALKFENPNLALIYLTIEDGELDGEGEQIVGIAYKDDAGKLWKLEKLEDSSDMVGKFTIRNIVRPAATKFFKVSPTGQRTIIRFASLQVASYGVIAVVFIVLCIVYRIGVSIVYWLLRKARQRLYLVHFFDSILGGMFMLILAFVIVVVAAIALQIIARVANMPEITAVFQNTKVLIKILDFISGQAWFGSVNEIISKIPGVATTGDGESEILSIFHRK